MKITPALQKVPSVEHTHSCAALPAVQLLSSVCSTTYNAYYAVQAGITQGLRSVGMPTASAMYAMASLESYALAKALFYQTVTYADAPEAYGLQTFLEEDQGKNPVLLIHGAVGSWNYLGDVATSLRAAGHPVFVVNLGAGGVTEEKRKKVHGLIAQIQATYQEQFNEIPPDIDLVAHSMGGAMAFAAVFSEKTSSISGETLYVDHLGMKQDGIGKIVTLALPYNQDELSLLTSIGKEADAYTVLATHDALMQHKQSALPVDHTLFVPAEHVGIVFTPQACAAVHNILIGSNE